MQFKHPELLYALLLLVIPIFIHLFQLRRFQKVPFTNVAFLKKVTLQTRKSSQLKKWLILLTRLAAFTFLILAFAQPFSASKTALNTEKELVIYLDNSYSMQLKGNDGPLLQRAIQDLYNLSGTNSINWFTNNESHKNSTLQDFKEDILQVGYTQKQLSPKQIQLKAGQLFSKSTTADKRLIIVSDFQQKNDFNSFSSNETDSNTIDIVALNAREITNISIDSAYLLQDKLQVLISTQGDLESSIPISLYNQNNLIAKTSIDFKNEISNTISFDIDPKKTIKGKIEIVDDNLLYDNSLCFSINAKNKIKVLAINEAPSSYLERIYNQEEFLLTQQNYDQLNYSSFVEQNLIVLNELKQLPESLQTALLSYSNQGGSLLIIPSSDSNIDQYNTLLLQLELGNFSELENQERKISKIIFDHPIYSNVFEKQVANFQYPKVNSFFPLVNTATSLLEYEDSSPFIVQKGTIYLSSASIQKENSNFQSSPLIVPTLYNIAQRSLPLAELYYEIGQQNSYAVPVDLLQDEIVTIADSTTQYIPLQQSKEGHVLIHTEEEPSKASIYSIKKDQESIQNISYNYNRSESNLIFTNPEEWPGVTVHNSIESLFTEIATENTINSYWKWFAIFALLFLIIEMLIIKFYK